MLKKSSKLILITVVTILLLFFLHYIRVLSPLENLIVSTTKPIFHGVYKTSNWIGENYLDYQSRQRLLQENKQLKDDLVTLLREKSQYLVEKEENEFLRSQLKVLQDNNYEYEIARVIGKNVDNTQNSLVIDKGTKNNILVGQPVLAEQGILVGKIIKVTKNSAMVLLINDDLSKVAAKIQNDAKTIGIVEGEYGLGIKMRLIPKIELVKETDIVVTSGLEKYVPPNLIIGQIDNVVDQPEALFQEASINSIVDLSKVTLVNVIIEKIEND